MALWLLMAALPGSALADNFADVHYDAGDDALVVTMQYRGTNPDHRFSLRWGRCKQAPNGGGRQIVAEVIDSQWRDAAQRDFVATTRFPPARRQLSTRDSHAQKRAAFLFFGAGACTGCCTALTPAVSVRNFRPGPAGTRPPRSRR